MRFMMSKMVVISFTIYLVFYVPRILDLKKNKFTKTTKGIKISDVVDCTIDFASFVIFGVNGYHLPICFTLIY